MIRELKISKQQFRSLFEFNRIVMIFFTGSTDRVKNGLLQEMQRTGTILNFNDGKINQGNEWICQNQSSRINKPVGSTTIYRLKKINNSRHFISFA